MKGECEYERGCEGEGESDRGPSGGRVVGKECKEGSGEVEGALLSHHLLSGREFPKLLVQHLRMREALSRTTDSTLAV